MKKKQIFTSKRAVQVCSLFSTKMDCEVRVDPGSNCVRITENAVSVGIKKGLSDSEKEETLQRCLTIAKNSALRREFRLAATGEITMGIPDHIDPDEFRAVCLSLAYLFGYKSLQGVFRGRDATLLPSIYQMQDDCKGIEPLHTVTKLFTGSLSDSASVFTEYERWEITNGLDLKRLALDLFNEQEQKQEYEEQEQEQGEEGSDSTESEQGDDQQDQEGDGESGNEQGQEGSEQEGDADPQEGEGDSTESETSADKVTESILKGTLHDRDNQADDEERDIKARINKNIVVTNNFMEFHDALGTADKGFSYGEGPLSRTVFIKIGIELNNKMKVGSRLTRFFLGHKKTMYKKGLRHGLLDRRRASLGLKSDKLFKKKVIENTSLNTDAVIILDCSGSMLRDAKGDRPDPYHPPRACMAAAAVSQLVTFYQNIGINCAIVGHNIREAAVFGRVVIDEEIDKKGADTRNKVAPVLSNGRESAIYMIKDFRKRISSKKLLKGMCEPKLYGYCNADNGVIWYAMNMLLARGNEKMHITVVSDGVPTGIYFPAYKECLERYNEEVLIHQSEWDQGIHATRLAVQYARDEGIVVNCVSMCNQGNGLIYGEDSSYTISNPEELADALYKINVKGEEK